MDEALWGEYRGRLLSFVRSRVEDADTAEDIVHDVLLRAVRGRAGLRDPGRFGPWLYQAARHAVVDHYRRRRPTEPLPADLAATDTEPGRAAVLELAQCLRPLMDSLPSHYRDALLLSELEGLTQAETARKLGLGLSGAKSRVQRGRALLAEALQRCCAVEVDHRGAAVDYEQRHGCPSTEACPDCA